MTPFARRGKDFYLVDRQGDTARVYDAASGRLYDPKPLSTLLARGYWQPYSGKVPERKPGGKL